MPTSSPLILAIGDSLIAGYGLARTESFPAQLEAALQPGYPGARVVNAGESGDTTGDVRRRLPRVLSRLDALPALAIVQVGPNDVLRGMPPAQTRDNLSAIVMELERCGMPTTCGSSATDALIAEQAARYATPHSCLRPAGSV
jgi:acyl-CoA thioesterase I